MTTPRALAVAAITAAALATPALAHPFGWRVSKDSGEPGQGALQIVFLWHIHHMMNDPLPIGYDGWIDDDLAFEEFLANDPTMDVYTLDEGTKIALEVVGFDPGVKLRTTGDLDNFVDAPGQQWSIGTGGSSFFTYATWHIDRSDPSWQPQAFYSASFRIIDLSGTLDPSPTYTFLMDPIPAIPAPGALALLAPLALARRRR